jgi:hypothetical protein
MKEVTGRLILLISLIGIVFALPFDYIRKAQDVEGRARNLAALVGGVQEAEEEISTAFDIPLADLTDAADQEEFNLSELMLGGTSFFELHEIESFLMEKLQESDELPKLYPPLNVFCRRLDQGVELNWSPNPQNEALKENLADNPLLTLGYRIYRWTSNRASRPEALETLPYHRNQFIDTEIKPFASRYFYGVLCVFQGTVAEHRTLIESTHSEVVSIEMEDRFRLRIIGGDAEKVEIEVTRTVVGILQSQRFVVREGEMIGGVREIPGQGQADFSTFLTLSAIRIREDQREETIQHPVFNSDGSRSLDPITRKPIFDPVLEIRPYQVLSIECEDPYGNKRIVEES